MIRRWIGLDYLSFGLTAARSPKIFMSVLVQSFSLVAIAEIGDKTQLLSILLAARFRTFWPIIAGILVATLINHAAVAWVGNQMGGWLDPKTLNLGSSLLFIAIGLWTLIPDEAPAENFKSGGAFIASLVAFFFAEMGDKTQLATLTLGAEYSATTLVILGTTLGMLAANIPAVLCGETIVRKWPLKSIRIVACLLFVGLGAYGLFEYFYPTSPQ